MSKKLSVDERLRLLECGLEALAEKLGYRLLADVGSRSEKEPWIEMECVEGRQYGIKGHPWEKKKKDQS